MNTLTDYRRPGARYRSEAARSAWLGLGGWHLRDGGDWARVYASGSRRTVARRAVVCREAGAWVWMVEEFDLSSRRVRRIANRSRRGRWYVSAAAAMPWADLAARASD
ncbi:MAG TPA: hypothetical protein PLG22_07290 [Kiritimatiellia bacterium]|nr:hypothetical protein [Kiritimatiellia bacterium]